MIRTFLELVVEYPDPKLCTYKKYKGKPYYSIKYIENGETHIGYGTYNPKVLSQYLKEDFMLSAPPKPPKWVAEDRYVKNRFAIFPYCPRCNAEVTTGQCYCMICGQHIDWSEDDER